MSLVVVMDRGPRLCSSLAGKQSRGSRVGKCLTSGEERWLISRELRLKSSCKERKVSTWLLSCHWEWTSPNDQTPIRPSASLT